MTTILFLDDWALHFRRNFIRRMGSPTWVPEATLEDDIVEGTWNFPYVFQDKEAGICALSIRAFLTATPTQAATASFSASFTRKAPTGVTGRSQMCPRGPEWSGGDVQTRSSASTITTAMAGLFSSTRSRPISAGD